MPEKCYPCPCTNLLPMYPDYSERDLTTACTRPRIAQPSSARLGAVGVECAAGDAGRYAASFWVTMKQRLSSALTLPWKLFPRLLIGYGLFWLVYDFSNVNLLS